MTLSAPLWFRSFFVIVRTSQVEQTLLPTLTTAIHQIKPGIATNDGMTMNDLIGDSPSAYQRCSSAWLIGGFAVLALLLSVVVFMGPLLIPSVSGHVKLEFAWR